MNDDQDWKPPVFTNPPTAPDGVGLAQPAPVTPHGYGPPASSAPPAGSWTAPPKPGLIPLRPLTLGAILTASFQVLRRNPRPTFGFAFGVQSIVMVVSIVIVGLVSFAAAARLVTATVDDSVEIGAGALVITVLSTLIPGILSMVFLALVQGILMLEIQRATLGEKLTLRQLWRRARGRLGALVGWMSLVALALLVIVGVLVVVIMLLVAIGTIGIALAVMVGIFGGLAMLAGMVWIGTKLSLVPSVLMGERTTLRVAVGRSWSLIDGYFWRTFGIQLLVSAILGVAMQVVTVPVQLLAPMAVFLVDPNGTDSSAAIVVVILVALVSFLVILVMSSIALVVQSATTGLIYIDLRMRQEGLDLELARYVETTSAGGEAEDPYLRERTATGYTSSVQPLPPQGESPWA